MSDQITPRIFKIVAQRIVEDSTTAHLSNEDVRNLLKSTYPEVAQAAIRERMEGEVRIVEYLPQPGRKG